MEELSGNGIKKTKMKQRQKITKRLTTKKSIKDPSILSSNSLDKT